MVCCTPVSSCLQRHTRPFKRGNEPQPLRSVRGCNAQGAAVGNLVDSDTSASIPVKWLPLRFHYCLQDVYDLCEALRLGCSFLCLCRYSHGSPSYRCCSARSAVLCLHSYPSLPSKHTATISSASLLCHPPSTRHPLIPLTLPPHPGASRLCLTSTAMSSRTTGKLRVCPRRRTQAASHSACCTVTRDLAGVLFVVVLASRQL